MDFHGVEPRFHGAAGGLHIGIDHAFDIPRVHDAGVFRRGEAGDHGNKQAWTAGSWRVPEASAVLELDGDLPIVAVYGGGEFGEPLDHEVVGNAEAEIKAVAAAGHIASTMFMPTPPLARSSWYRMSFSVASPLTAAW